MKRKKMWLLLWLLGAFITVAYIEHAAWARSETHQRAMRYVGELQDQRRATVIALHNVTEMLETMTLAINTHPRLAMARDEAHLIQRVVSHARQVVAATVGENPRIDYSHMRLDSPFARWPYDPQGKVKL